MMQKYILSIIALIALSSGVFAHSGRTNAKGCHAGSQPYHCHNSGGSSTGSSASKKRTAGEDVYNAAFCNSVGGRTEVRHTYQHPSGSSYVKVDCETATHVYEGGLDKRSSLDSVQQALFFSHLTGKKPAVVIYDTDGKIGRFEHRIKTACDLAAVEFIGAP